MRGEAGKSWNNGRHPVDYELTMYWLGFLPADGAYFCAQIRTGSRLSRFIVVERVFLIEYGDFVEE
jgi:hypothetical protein